jgi:hypothetical protein
MQSSGRAAADTDANGTVDRDGEEAERAARWADLGAAMEEVLAEVWREEAWWATEDRIDTAVRYLVPDRREHPDP